MIYFLHSDNESLINYKINKLNKNNNTITKEFIDRDNSFSAFNKLIEYNLLNNNSFYVFYNLDIFTLKKSSLLKKHINFIIQTLNKSIYDVVIIIDKPLLLNNDYLKQIDAEYTYVDFQENDANINLYLKEFTTSNNITINKQNLNKIRQNLDNDLYSITSELLKLSTYEDPITSKTISKLSYKSVGSNVFDLIEYIINQDYIKTKELFDTLIKEGSDPVQILGLIASQIKFIYQVKLLQDRSSDNISKLLKANKYRIDITLRKYKSINIQKIRNLYFNVSDTDYKIKSGMLPPLNIIDYILV